MRLIRNFDESGVSRRDLILPDYGKTVDDYIRAHKAPFSALVFIDGDKVVAVDSDGKTIKEGEAGVNDVSVIQSALNSLTSGRTWKEKVVLKGGFTISSPLKIPSYTIFDALSAELKIADGADSRLIEQTETTENIDILIGRVDGNKANQTVSQEGIIRIENVTNLNLICEEMFNAKGHGIYLKNCKKGFIKAYLHDNGDATYGTGLMLFGCEELELDVISDDNSFHGVVLKNSTRFCKGTIIARGNAWHGIILWQDGAWDDPYYVECCVLDVIAIGNGKVGVYLDKSARQNEVRAIAWNNGGHGVYLDVGTNKNEVFAIAYGNGSSGIHITSGKYNKISGLSGFNHGHGVAIVAPDYQDANWNKIVDMLVENNNQAEGDYDGIHIEGSATYACNYNEIINCAILSTKAGTSGYAIKTVTNVDYTRIENCRAKWNGGGGLSLVDSSPIFGRNYEQIATVNSGTATITAGSTSVTVNHGLVSSPSKILVTPYADTRFWVSNKTATSFDINIPSALASDADFDWEAEV